MEEVQENSIKKTIDFMVELADKERAESYEYALFEGCKSIAEVVEQLDFYQTKLALCAYDKLKNLGMKTSNEKWYRVQGMAFFLAKLKKEIKDNEGSVCCVDKAHGRTIAFLQKD